MIRIDNIRTSSDTSPSSVALTIGNFDGCHLGHQALLNAVIQAAQGRGLSAAVMTFDPAPDQYFKGASVHSPRLFTTDQKVRAMTESGIDLIVVETFDQALAEMDRQDFFDELIRKKLRTKELIVGYDFKFGRGRKGGAAFLADACKKAGIGFHEGESVMHESLPVSSTRVREGIARGAIEEIQKMLGRPYMLEGHVGPGDRKGRTLGFPTANLTGCPQLLPRLGVYAGLVSFEAGPPVMRSPATSYPAVINVGQRPTLGGSPEIRTEAYCLDAAFGSDELYGRPMAIYLTHRLRDEQKFQDLAELKTAIGNDIKLARSLMMI